MAFKKNMYICLLRPVDLVYCSAFILAMRALMAAIRSACESVAEEEEGAAAASSADALPLLRTADNLADRASAEEPSVVALDALKRALKDDREELPPPPASAAIGEGAGEAAGEAAGDTKAGT